MAQIAPKIGQVTCPYNRKHKASLFLDRHGSPFIRCDWCGFTLFPQYPGFAWKQLMRTLKEQAVWDKELKQLLKERGRL